ncbi:hypothetical protein ACIA6E_12235 [Streptomyces sp. NPDC051815]|uniref:hypothetical protein n=1 Tax=Streptomyces sp. NPDC051815 TaxID=3365674 RepID=UPI00378D735F
MGQERGALGTAGFTQIEITPTRAVADGMLAAVVHATKPPTYASCCGKGDHTTKGASR